LQQNATANAIVSCILYLLAVSQVCLSRCVYF